jgi:LmbE family N-acetylglucosaminyl deacetylase
LFIYYSWFSPFEDHCSASVYTKDMKKIIFGIFAHPDDEAFGPSGALLKAVREGAELHLFTLTNGSAGTNPDSLKDLGTVRLEEWKKAGALFGAKSMHYLGYKDGHLDNIGMIEASDRIRTIVSSILENTPKEAIVEFITLDLNGYTGHIDHIVAARAASFVFYTLKQNDSRLGCIKFACFPKALAKDVNVDWIFMEPGRSPEEITETVDARNLRSDLLDIIHAHYTQRIDGETMIKSQGDNLGLNYFIVRR